MARETSSEGLPGFARPAGILFVLITAFFGGQYTAQRPSAVDDETKRGSASGDESKKANEDKEKKKPTIRDPALAALADSVAERISKRYEFSYDDDSPRADELIRPELRTAIANDNLYAVMATVPDPDLTALGQYADTVLEMIQRAAEVRRFYLKRTVLPWRIKDPPKNRPPDPRFTGHPGVLLFENAQDRPPTVRRLLVYLVGESPNAGVDRAAVQVAVKSFDQLRSEKQEVWPIVGPSYSGVIQSLDAALEALNVRGVAVTGSATNKNLVERPWNSLCLTSAIANDELADEKFWEFVRKHRGYAPETLLLAEANTPFGRGGVKLVGTERGPPMMETIVFPQHLARLRTAYEKDPDLRSFGAARPQTQAPRRQLDLNSSRTAEPLDQAPVFDTALKTQTLERSLEEIARYVADRKPRLVKIAATDVLDSIFLMSFLRSRYPNVRFYTLDSDALFTHRAPGIDQEGMLLVSPNPLLLATQADNPKISFSSRLAQGTYNATLRTLNDWILPQFVAEKSPFEEQFWVTVVGNGAFWPITVLGNADPAAVRAVLGNVPAAWSLLWITATSVWLWLVLGCRGKLPPGLRPLWMRLPGEKKFEWAGLILMGAVAAAIGIVGLYHQTGAAWYGNTATLQFAVHRAVHMGSGVSPGALALLALAPLVFWPFHEVIRQREGALFRPPLPKVPETEQLLNDQENIFPPLEQPFFVPLGVAIGTAFVPLVAVTAFVGGVRTLESFVYDFLLSCVLLSGLVLLIGSFLRLLGLWHVLRQLLRMLEMHPVHRAFDRLHGDTWSDIWKSAGIHRFRRLIGKNIVRLRVIRFNDGPDEKRRAGYMEKLSSCEKQLLHDSGSANELTALRSADVVLQEACEHLCESHLSQAWNRDGAPLDEPTHNAAEEVFALRYLAMICFLMSQMKVQVQFLVFTLVCYLVACVVYPIQPIRQIQLVLTVSFTIVMATVIWIFLKLDIDEVLSELSDTKAGHVDIQFFVRTVAQFGIPLVIVLGVVFPDLGRGVFFWVQQGLQALR